MCVAALAHLRWLHRFLLEQKPVGLVCHARASRQPRRACAVLEVQRIIIADGAALQPPPLAPAHITVVVVDDSGIRGGVAVGPDVELRWAPVLILTCRFDDFAWVHGESRLPARLRHRVCDHRTHAVACIEDCTVMAKMAWDAAAVSQGVFLFMPLPGGRMIGTGRLVCASTFCASAAALAAAAGGSGALHAAAACLDAAAAAGHAFTALSAAAGHAPAAGSGRAAGTAATAAAATASCYRTASSHRRCVVRRPGACKGGET